MECPKCINGELVKKEEPGMLEQISESNGLGLTVIGVFASAATNLVGSDKVYYECDSCNYRLNE